MGSKVLSLEGLPEPIARGLEVVADIARKVAQREGTAAAAAPGLPVWLLGVIGGLSREEAYDE